MPELWLLQQQVDVSFSGNLVRSNLRDKSKRGNKKPSSKDDGLKKRLSDEY